LVKFIETCPKLEAIHVNLKQVSQEILEAVISGAKRLKNKNFVFHATNCYGEKKVGLEQLFEGYRRNPLSEVRNIRIKCSKMNQEEYYHLMNM